MASAGKPLYTVNRSKQEVTEGTEVLVSHRVQMFALRDNQPVSKGYIESGQKVTVLADRTRAAFRLGFKFVYIKTQDDDYGYIPKHVINDFVFAKANLHLTGVSYGGDVMLADGTRNDALVFRSNDKDKLRCVRCGGKANDHKLYESKDAEVMCRKVVQQLTQESLSIEEVYGHQGGGKRGVMVGVLIGRKKMYLACSGRNVREFTNMLQRANPQCVIADDIDADDKIRTDHLGNCLTIQKICDFTGLNSFDASGLNCAAPKLIQACYLNGDQPEALSEKWVGKDSGHLVTQETIKSCDRCRPIIALMLCPIRTRDT
jgi:hypothetical protein